MEDIKDRPLDRERELLSLLPADVARASKFLPRRPALSKVLEPDEIEPVFSHRSFWIKSALMFVSSDLIFSRMFCGIFRASCLPSAQSAVARYLLVTYQEFLELTVNVATIYSALVGRLPGIQC